MTDSIQRTDIGRRVEMGFGFLFGAVGLVCLAFVIWFVSMMIINRVFSVFGIAVLGFCALITYFFLNIAWKVISNRPGRMISSTNMYVLAVLFLSLASIFSFWGIQKHDLYQIPGIFMCAILGGFFLWVEYPFKRKGIRP